MQLWLSPILKALNRVGGKISVYFRDDDAGWADDRLLSLLDVFESHCVPVDLAVIPTALTAQLACQLRQRIETHRQILGLHQHGYAHVNHQTTGRKSEFGDQRSLLEQYADIAAGQQILRNAFGSLIQPIFTPPWNRCTQDTVEVLKELGFKSLSRDITAEPLETGKLTETPVHIDWSGKFRGEEMVPFPLGERIAEVIQQTAKIGIMLHHQCMDGIERQRLATLLNVFSGYPKVHLTPMSEMLP
ncbi:MAG: hypothetical protein AXA67_05835 [Methylothermaceae bacteria B42]|nr:MAG: hypothetical protein AXA67_05835 [Methylothermaceae bacteria B42]HHJ38678.1 hypothetical protein [Methylothermaceae bacterium]